MVGWAWLSLAGTECHLRGAELVSEWYLGSEVETPRRRLPGLPGYRLAALRPGPGLGPVWAGAEEGAQQGEGREGGLAGARGGQHQAEQQPGHGGSHLLSNLTILTSDWT